MAAADIFLVLAKLVKLFCPTGIYIGEFLHRRENAKAKNTIISCRYVERPPNTTHAARLIGVRGGQFTEIVLRQLL